jgi:hypothetical protein
MRQCTTERIALHKFAMIGMLDQARPLMCASIMPDLIPSALPAGRLRPREGGTEPHL